MKEHEILAIANEVLQVIDNHNGYTYADIHTIVRMIQEHTEVGTYGSLFTSGKTINKENKIMSQSNVSEEIIMYTVKDIKNIFKCGLKQAYELANANGFPRIKIGKKILVEKKALENWIDKNKGRNVLLP